MAKLGEGLREGIGIIKGAALDSVGLSGAKAVWHDTREITIPQWYTIPIAAGASVMGEIETFILPNTTRDFIIEDNVSTYSEYLKSKAALAASALLDGLTLAGAVGVGILTKQLEAAIATKVGLNAATSAVVRTADSIQRRRIRESTV